MSGEIKFEGMDELLLALQKMGAEGDIITEQALIAGAETLKEEAETRAPYKTGKLKANIKIGEIREDKKGRRSIVVGPAKGDISKVFYGKFSEYGTVKEPAKPWLRPAFDESKDKIGKKMEDTIADRIEGVFKGK